jgi:FecR protein
MKATSGSIAILLSIALIGATSRAQETSDPGQTSDKAEATAVIPPESSSAASSSPGVRIVRLSQVNGEVQLDRKTDRGFEQAFANLPIAQSQRLQTKEGLAEVEFEDNSTLRITPNSQIEFPALQRTAAGTTITTIKLLSGTLYVSLAGTKGNEFTVAFGNDTIVVNPSTHIRIDTDASKSQLAVFNGTVQVTNSSGTVTVGKNKSLAFDAAGQTPPLVAKNEEPGTFDEWDKKEMDYHNLRSVPASFGSGGSSYLYGVNDLNYYGSFADTGCGSMWRPYLASAAFDPFANGVWAWYPGAGYSWVSPYPWGWTPFHYGSWNYCNNGGWGWRPGGQWTGIANYQTTLNPTKCPTCLRPPRPPVTGQSTLVVVNTKPLAVSRLSSSDTFVFHKDSAGLGVPRESFGKLNKISAGVAQHGSVSTPAFVSNPAGPAEHGNAAWAHNNAEGQSRSTNATAAHTDQSAHSGGNWSGASHGSSPNPTSSGGGWSGGSHASAPSAPSPSSGAAAPSGAHH